MVLRAGVMGILLLLLPPLAAERLPAEAMDAEWWWTVEELAGSQAYVEACELVGCGSAPPTHHPVVLGPAAADAASYAVIAALRSDADATAPGLWRLINRLIVVGATLKLPFSNTLLAAAISNDQDQVVRTILHRTTCVPPATAPLRPEEGRPSWMLTDPLQHPPPQLPPLVEVIRAAAPYPGIDVHTRPGWSTILVHLQMHPGGKTYVGGGSGSQDVDGDLQGAEASTSNNGHPSVDPPVPQPSQKHGQAASNEMATFVGAMLGSAAESRLRSGFVASPVTAFC
jgi:hypothetical protein